MTNRIRSPWITNVSKNNVKYRLFCFPFAGAGSNIYRSWINELSPDIDVCPIQLPGRENRMTEPALDNVHDVVRFIAPEIAQYTDVPYAFFGHCIGALISYELALKMKKLGLNSPDHLYISAFRAPDQKNPNRELHQLNDDDLKLEIKGYGGFSDEVLANDDIMRSIIPMLRADFALHEKYRYTGKEDVDCPVTLFYGDQDHIVRKEHMESWEKVSSHNVDLHSISGGHFFIIQKREEVLDIIRNQVGQMCSA